MRNFFLKNILTICILLISRNFSAQDDMRFTHISTEKGLSNSDIRKILQDKDGFIWIGTSDGLNKYDGINFKVYRKNSRDKTSIQDNVITSLCIDSRGNLWIGTFNGGLSRYIKEKDCFENYLNNPKDSGSILDNTIECIANDSKGQLWIASFWGLQMYNPGKNNFTRYPENPMITITSKGLQQIRKIIKNKALNDRLELIIGKTLPQDKLVEYLQGVVPRDEVLEYKETIKEKSIISLNNKTIAEIHLRTISPDKYGNIWIGYTDGMVSCFNIYSRNFKHYSFTTHYNSVQGELFVSDILADNENIWVATHGEGILIFNSKTEKWKKFEKITEPFVNAVFKDNKNNIWFALSEKGVAKYNENKELIFYQHNLNDKNSLSGNNISCIFSDTQNNLWVGCFQGDIDFATQQKSFQSFGLYNSGNLTYNNVSSVIEDDEKNLWIGFYNFGGLDVVDEITAKKRHIFPQKNNKSALGEGTVHTLFIDSHKNLWIGTYLGGLQMYDRKNDRFVTYIHNQADSNSISGNDIRKITEDKEGNLWIATHGGGIEMFNLKNKKFKHYRVNYLNLKYAISSDWVYSVFCDKDDNIWVGTVEGISKIEKNSIIIKHFKNQAENEKSLSNNHVYAVFQDSNGKMWFGTAEGLNMFDQKTGNFRTFTKKEGLPNDNITGILEDNNKNLWISTYKGLSRFSLFDFSVKNFDESDGLETDEFLLPGGFKTKTGEIYFGGRKGLICISPEDIKYNTFKPPVYLTDFKLFNQTISVDPSSKSGFHLDTLITYSNQLTLQYSQNVLTFEFIALNYILPEKNQYEYKMEGFDDFWNKIGNKHDVTYTNLPPGSYILRVKASNNDGLWNEKGASIRLVIKPPWWKTYLAYSIYLLIVVILLFWYRYSILQRQKFRLNLEMERMEVKRMHELDMMKLRFFTNITHEFRTPITLILEPIEKLIKTVHEEYMQFQFTLIQRNAKRLLRLINQLMDVRKLETDGFKLEASSGDIVKFTRELANSFSYEVQERNINFSIISEHEKIELRFDPDKIDKILYNLIANAFKFTPDNGTITIHLSIVKGNQIKIDESSENMLEIIVEDSGIGISGKDLPKIFERFYQADTSYKNIGTGIGLALAKELVELHLGKISIESELGKGSRFRVLLPIEKELMTAPALQNNALFKFEVIAKPGFKEQKKLSPGNLVHDTGKLPLLLIVEDNSDLRAFIKNEFLSHFQIIEATDGLKGFDKAVSEIPDIIISDIMMPAMDGVELCKKLKEDERTSHIPIILLTSRISEQQVLEGLETGADDYITKPFSTALLRARAQNLIKSRRLLRNQFSKLPNISNSAISPTSTDQKFLLKVFQIVEKYFSDSDFDAFRFASEIGMSRSQLYRKINGLTGLSVNELIRNIRLKKAAELLASKDLNVTETSSAVGFNDITYFIRCFSKLYGVTPSKYSASLKK